MSSNMSREHFEPHAQPVVRIRGPKRTLSDALRPLALQFRQFQHSGMYPEYLVALTETLDT